MLLTRSRFELPKIHAHFIGESKNPENLVTDGINFARELTVLGVGIYKEDAIIVYGYPSEWHANSAGFGLENAIVLNAGDAS
ncbi:hypothetical protein N7466_001640 [Penicillium verhagenii]|uniref:uncharacterized protein n=1 Tax=Penicillium verhagenii TaxID=1562060 RepID=UPI002545736A|nr:uncharacterized protein N7466_001640 [Penicillium verhagenii]KAJ5938506.1 hypothetical protein N7466_001640 [Penicillium verhagenii]